jgi:hypothetical protein
VSEELQFEDDELLREALEEVAEADIGDLIEEPWGSTAVAAAEQIARDGADDDELWDLARDAVDRVLARSQLLEVTEDGGALHRHLEDLRRRLA